MVERREVERSSHPLSAGHASLLILTQEDNPTNLRYVSRVVAAYLSFPRGRRC